MTRSTQEDRELQALRAYAREISKAITSLTIGAGSEWFKPVAGDHYVDPAFAVTRLAEMLDQGRQARRDLARLRALNTTGGSNDR